ncbi:TPA: hypothetical protein DCY65_03505 [Candidatus Acetothermia bacterium]|nr:hypothetical protein [Candidatus Acetothermia bacterium]
MGQVFNLGVRPRQADARWLGLHSWFEFIEGWYNPHRGYSALGYESPLGYERRYAGQDASERSKEELVGRWST